MLFWLKKSNKTERNDGLILSMETLEDRQMLAGDVSVALVGDYLEIRKEIASKLKSATPSSPFPVAEQTSIVGELQ